jgi:hypothetical protein
MNKDKEMNNFSHPLISVSGLAERATKILLKRP